MISKRTVLGLTVLTFVTASSSAARAEEPRGLYAAIGGIYSNFDASGTLSRPVHQSDGDGFGAGVLVGYQFNPYVGIETGWLYLGETRGHGTDSSNVPVRRTADASGALFQAVGSYPCTDWLSVYGNLGGLLWDSKSTTKASTQSVVDHEDGFGLALGAGVQAQVHTNIAFRLGYTRFFDIDVNTAMVSVVFNGWDAF